MSQQYVETWNYSLNVATDLHLYFEHFQKLQPGAQWKCMDKDWVKIMAVLWVSNFFWNKEQDTLIEVNVTLEQVSQRGGSCPIPESTQGQVGWGCEQVDLVQSVPVHCRWLELDLWGSFQPKPFCDFHVLWCSSQVFSKVYPPWC